MGPPTIAGTRGPTQSISAIKDQWTTSKIHPARHYGGRGASATIPPVMKKPSVMKIPSVIVPPWPSPPLLADTSCTNPGRTSRDSCHRGNVSRRSQPRRSIPPPGGLLPPDLSLLVRRTGDRHIDGGGGRIRIPRYQPSTRDRIEYTWGCEHQAENEETDEESLGETRACLRKVVWSEGRAAFVGEERAVFLSRGENKNFADTTTKPPNDIHEGTPPGILSNHRILSPRACN